MSKLKILYLLPVVFVLLTTTAFSQEWEELTSGTTNNLKSITFVDALTGYTAGMNGLVLKTIDGGITWQAQTSNTIAGLNSISFANSDIGVACGEEATVIVTSNGGSSWTVLEEGWWMTLYAAHQFDENSGVAGGVNTINQPFCFYTTDGWVTHDAFIYYVNWENVGYEATIYGIQYLDSNTIVTANRIWNGFGAVCISTDNGSSFQTSHWTGSGLLALDLLNENTFYTAGEFGYIARTTDGGSSWTTLGSGTNNNLRGIAFLNENIGFAAGDNGVVLKTTDGGDTWETEEVPVFANFTSIDIVDNDVFVCGDNGVILHLNYTVNSAPEEFELITPTDGTIVEREEITFSWTESTDPENDDISYELTLSSIDFEESFTTAETTIAIDLLSLELPETEVEFSWTVEATDGTNTTTAANAPFEFTIVAANQPPGEFSRLAPLDSSMVERGMINFSWSEAIDPDEDEVIYNYSIHFGNNLLDESTTSTSIELNITDYDIPTDSFEVIWEVFATDNIYVIEASNGQGSFYVEPENAIGDKDPVAIDGFELSSAWPNPFNSTVNYSVQTSNAGQLNITVFDILGRVVYEESMQISAGKHLQTWKAHDKNNLILPNGVYFLKTKFSSNGGNSYSGMKKLILIK